MAWQSIRPKHKSLQDVGSGGSHTNLTNFYDSNPKGFIDLRDVGSGGSHINLSETSYTYLDSGSSVTLNINEFLGMHDTQGTTTITTTIEEHQPLSDNVGTNPVVTGDSGPITDEVTFTITKTIDEYLPIVDVFGREVPPNDNSHQPLVDEVTLTVTLNIDEYLGLSDSETEAFEQVTVSATVVLQVFGDYHQTGSNVLQVFGDNHFNATTNINVLEDNLIAVTNASSVDNPTNPTVIVNGVVLLSHPSTLPDNPEDAEIFVAVNCDVLPTSGGELFGFSLNITGEGGTFTLETENSPGRLNGNVDLFAGLRGTINEIGQEESSTGAKYVAAGILGDGNLYEQVSITLAQDEVGKDTVLNQRFTNTGLQTVSGMALLIARTCGINLHWAAQDAPLNDISIEAGQTALEALTSLASRVGAVLRWNGNRSYTVVDPDKSSGVWFVPHPCLLLSNGCGFRNLVDRGETKNSGTISTASGGFGASGSGSSGSDLGQRSRGDLKSAFNPTVDTLKPSNFGVGNSSFGSAMGSSGGSTGFRIIPSPGAKDAKKATLPPGPNQELAPDQENFDSPVIDPTNSEDSEKGGVIAAVQQLTKITKRLTVDDPPLIYDLPFDYADVYIQILTTSDGNGAFVTTDPTVYFRFDGGIINTDIGGILIPQVRIDANTFPEDGTNTQVDSGNFVLTLSAVRRTLSGENTSLTDSADQNYPGKKLDLNNDGIPDAIDLNGDGLPDADLLDSDNDGVPDSIDINRDGVPDVMGTDDKAVANALNPSSAFGKASDASSNRQKSVLGTEQDQYKTIKVYSGTISCIFFGSIPLPGMYAQVDTGRMVVSGIVESVSITPPGILNIQVARYQKIVFK